MEKTTNHEVSITKIEVKKENLNEDIKEFAQNAMNELLGWYGYENTREELRIPTTCRSHSDSNSSGLSPKSSDCCGWCGKTVDEAAALSSGPTVFCSELCFSHSRRANFKKNKTCDWCRHVKHTVSYVDIQDGASQLQFCSDKCLNQYKMHLFCRETRAHLELHPHHLRVEESSSGTLITPDLWLKNCKSPELRSPSPNISPKPPEKPFQISPLSLVASPRPAKILEVSESSKRHLLKGQKKMRKRLPATVTCVSNVSNDVDKISLSVDDVPQDLRIRHTPTDFVNKLPIENENPPVFTPIKLPVESRIPSSKPEPEARPLPSNNINSLQPFHSLIPPPTTLVPYPFIIPIPIPIPIPLPIKRDDKVERKDCSSQTDEIEETKTVFGDIDVSGKEVFKVLKRPLKKRKRTCEQKSKMILKARKVILSTN